MTKKVTIDYLIERLYKEVSYNGYMAVDVDGIQEAIGSFGDIETEFDVLFNRILFEIDTMQNYGYEYTQEYNSDNFFKTERNVNTYINRLKRYCKKYASKVNIKESLLKEIEDL